MAYLNFLVSVSEQQVLALRKDNKALLRPSLLVAVSHLVGSWVQVQPLGRLLGQALDEGELVNEHLWHPLRSPVYHGPEDVRTLHQQLNDAWTFATRQQARPDLSIDPNEIHKVLNIFRHASDHGECVVSVLDRPSDRERADRVRIPFVASDGSQLNADDSKQSNGIGRWSDWTLVGSVAVSVTLGILGLCYWRYRRLTKVRK